MREHILIISLIKPDTDLWSTGLFELMVNFRSILCVNNNTVQSELTFRSPLFKPHTWYDYVHYKSLEFWIASLNFLDQKKKKKILLISEKEILFLPIQISS
jgi:hypothetical protein